MGDGRRGLRLLGLLLAVLALGFGLSGCGDDDDGDGDVEAYCEDTLAIETIPEPDIDFESMSEEEQAEAAKEFASEELVPLAEKIQANAPEEIADDIDTLVAAVDEIAETGDFGVFDSAETEEASDNAHAFDLANCGWESSEVTAREYEFEGVAAEYEAGPTSFEFSNAGEELHEFIVLKKKADTEESFDELLELPQEEAEGKVDEVGAVFGEPGDDDYLVADLEEGEYIALCFIPVGLTPEAAAAAEEGGEEPQGPPHFTQGMRAEFTVS